MKGNMFVRAFFKVADNVKRLGFCGVYAQGIFHAIEPNQCYTQAIY